MLLRDFCCLWQGGVLGITKLSIIFATLHIGPFYFPPQLLTKGENKTTLLTFTRIILHYRFVSPTRSILAGSVILVKIRFITMLSFEPYELLWRRRVWRHGRQESFRLGLRAWPWALYSRLHRANAWYCNAPRNRPRWLWRLQAIEEFAPGCMCSLSFCDSVPVFRCSEGSTAMF